ncbi:MAG: M20/M25/M40 family metallo-hydrolase [Herpetosiphonaceae bacterium]|nr:M20/M25/M40 family metallo-hydrolase [Herpetosiphonaceae bacterium]
MADQDTPTLVDNSMLEHLRMLIAHPSVLGDDSELDTTATAIADLLRQCGLHVSVHPSEGAPIIIAHRAGRTKRHILFYNHYDVMPPGPWRDWHHEPFVMAEREGRLYGRGVASDKGNLIARLAAVKAILDRDGELPVGVTFLIEGDALQGSPYLPNLIADQAHKLQGDVIFGFGGMLDGQNVPYLYAGVRGRLLVMLRATGPNISLSADMSTSVVNPAWRLLWALNEIKNDTEEVLIEGFYDIVAAPSREASKLTRGLQIDEAGRLKAWGMKEFLFGMSGATLARAETFNPNCNLGSITVTTGVGPHPTIPIAAEAIIDFSLVPEQRPNEVVRLLREHLLANNFDDINVESIKGAYPPATTPLNSFALELVASQVESAYGITPQVVPLAPFAVPLHLFTAGMNVPALPLGLLQPDSALRGANESVPLANLQAMAALIHNVLAAFATFDNIP